MARKINPAKYRKLSPTELAKLGAPSKSERYVRADTKRITKRTTTISRRAYEQARLGTTLERAVKQRQSGERSYKTMATKEAAQKQRATWHAITQGKKFTATFEQRTRDRKITHLHPPPRPYTSEARSRGYRVSDAMRYKLPYLRERKLAGEHLPDGDWHSLRFPTTLRKPPVTKDFTPRLCACREPADEQGVVKYAPKSANPVPSLPCPAWVSSLSSGSSGSTYLSMNTR